MAFAIVAAAIIIAFGLFWLAVPAKRPANAPDSWTPNTRRSLGAGIALGGVILLVIVLLV